MKPGECTATGSGRWPNSAQRAVVQLDEGREPRRVAADDRQHEREAVARGAHHRLRAAADADPGADAARLGLRVDVLVRQRRRGCVPCPGDRLLGEQLREQVELLLEQPLVVGEVVAEQRERLGERAAPEDDLGPPAGDRVEGGEALEHPHRVVRAQHGDGGAQADALGAAGDRGQHDLGRRDGEVVAVVLPDPEEVDADRSASTPSSTTLRITCACGSRLARRGRR